MSNIFKSNSRFSVLSEDINDNNVVKKNNSKKQEDKKQENKKPENKKPEDNKPSIHLTENSFLREDHNSFKTDYTRRNYNRDYYNSKEYKERREKEDNIKKEEERLKKEARDKKSLSKESFPVFIHKNQNSSSNNLQITFKEKVSVIVEQKNITPIVNPIKPGWVEIRRDPNIKKTIYTYGEEEKRDIIGDNSYYHVLKALATLHNKRTNEYIDMWGYDSWENVFISPNYDYEYFDKLDELYELEMEEYNNNKLMDVEY